MDEVLKIIKDIQSGILKPIYFFMGEEAYFIDKLTSYMEQNILSDEEKGFNQMVFYGRDVSIEDIVSQAKRYPMMADKQVVIVKEAQELSRTIDRLESYLENPQPTTVLVFAFKYKSLDKRKKVTKLLAAKGVVFESKKLYENQVGAWVSRVLSGKGYKIDPKAAEMLVAFLGNDLGRIANELEKLEIILPKGTIISPDHIEENIGISKEFNVFEFRKAIGHRNQLQAYKIANYFANNPKDNPLVMTTSLVFSFFSQLLEYHGLKDKSPANVSKVLKVNPYFLSDYDIALKNYPMRKVSAIISQLRIIDLKSKGVNANAISQGDLLKEMLFHIFN